MLPDGDGILVGVFAEGSGRRRIEVISAATGLREPLVSDASFGRYVSTGHLIYYVGDTVYAAPFDPARRVVTVAAVPVLQSEPGLFGVGYLDVADSGSLVHIEAGATQRTQRLVWVSRDGQVTPVTEERAGYSSPRIRPDGTAVAVVVNRGSQEAFDIYTYDTVRGGRTRVTVNPRPEDAPVWHPQGTRLAFNALAEAGGFSLVWKAPDGTGETHSLVDVMNPASHMPGEMAIPTAWSPDGRTLLFLAADFGQLDIYRLALDDTGQPGKLEAWVGTEAQEHSASFSPNGQWVVYASDESGRYEVYVMPLTGAGGRTLVSTDGGGEPACSVDSCEIFYRNGDQMMVVEASTEPTFAAGTPRPLFDEPFSPMARLGVRNYGVTPDGQAFVMVQDETPDVPIRVVLNWHQVLLERVPLD